MSGSIVSMIILACFKNAIYADTDNIDYVWRIIIGLGALPGCAAIYFRLTIPETARYEMEVKGNIERAAKDTN